MNRSHTPEDIEKIQSGWRKRQISDDDDIQIYADAKQRIYDMDCNHERDMRNRTLEEVALEFDKMKAFGDTSASFATYVRMMKR